MNEEQKEGVLLTATPETDSRDVRRNSTGKVAPRASLSQSNSEGKIIPRYLRASTGSCHDFCKYGRKHSFETKGRSPTFPRYSGSSTPSVKGQNWVKMPSLGEKQKKSTVKQKAADRTKISEEKRLSPMKTVKPNQESKTNNPNTICHDMSGSSEESEIKCIFSSPSEEIKPLEGFGTIKQGALEKIGLCDDTETIPQKIPASLKKTEASRDSETTNKKKPCAKKVHLSLEPASAQQRTPFAKNFSASSRPKIKHKAPSPVKKAISSGKPKVSKKVAPSPANRFDASTRPALSRKSNLTFLKSESQLKPATGGAGRNVGNKIVKNVDLSKLGGKRTWKSPSDSLSPQPPVNHVSKSASPVKHAKKDEKAKLENDKVREKTLYIIEPGPTEDENIDFAQPQSSSCQPSPSSPSSALSSSSPLSSSSSVSDHAEEEHQDSESAFSEACDLISDHGGDGTCIAAQSEDKKSQRRLVIVCSEYKDQTAYELKFRRGKILNPQSDHSVTRRLRFRQGRRMGDSQSGKREMGKISFKMKELTCGESNLPDPETQTVVLRHQDVQDKKDTLGLFNHVIEETASKLVETRKSKVKALVGAFETVISLQESKPATPV